MHCNGKCQLTKQLHEHDKNDQQNTQKRFQVEMELVFIAPIYKASFFYEQDIITPLNGFYTPLTKQDFYAKILHPPTA